jgi:N-acetyl-gamma-glutamyl-phosphate reductase
MTNRITAGIIGAAGYTGGETLRLLLNHPHVQVQFVQSRSQKGKPVYAVHTDLRGDTDLVFADSPQPAAVLFLCLGHGESRQWLDSHPVAAETKIIDLGNDFRLGQHAPGRSFVYGLPEFQREAIRRAGSVANPGCFATAIQLSLLPLAAAGRLNTVHTVGITGSTGAGQKLQNTSHFSWRANNISPYKTLTHQHLSEIQRTLSALQPAPAALHFVPWRGDFARGIFTSSIIETPLSLDEATRLYQDFYAPHPFTRVADAVIDLKQAVNTNKCLLFLEKENDQLVVHAAIDNLLKGAAGQAVQNMNLMFGLEETAGLNLKSIGF